MGLTNPRTERIGTHGGRVKEEVPLQGTTSRGASPNRVKSLGLRELIDR